MFSLSNIHFALSSGNRGGQADGSGSGGNFMSGMAASVIGDLFRYILISQ